jgi:hypothetical protein
MAAPSPKDDEAANLVPNREGQTKQMPEQAMIKKYRFSGWIMLLNLGMIAYFAFLLLLAVAFAAIIFLFFQAGWNGSQAGLYLCFGLPAGLLLILVLVLLILRIGRAFFSYVLVSPQGLEYRYWPSYRIRCRWGDVECLGKYRSIFGLALHQVLFLKEDESTGWQGFVEVRRRLGADTQQFVPLTGIRGWPDGPFAEDLRCYLPALFAEEAVDTAPQRAEG